MIENRKIIDANAPEGDDIAALFEFHARCGADVSGHGVAELEAGQEAMLERFIAGRCTEVELRVLSSFLQQNPGWIRWIADRVKLDRTASQQH